MMQMPLILKEGFLMLTYSILNTFSSKYSEFSCQIGMILLGNIWDLTVVHRGVGVCLLYFCSCILLSRNRFFLHDALMVFLAPKCQAKVHETTRKLKSIEQLCCNILLLGLGDSICLLLSAQSTTTQKRLEL